MALVDYPDSEDSDDDRGMVPPKTAGNSTRSSSVKSKNVGDPKTGLPPLPDNFHDLYVSASRASNSDDPSLHDGRQRAAPHVEGQWPTHVYIEWRPSEEESSHLHDLLAKLDYSLSPAECFHSLLNSDLGSELPLHISLSRPIVLVARERQHFVNALTLALSVSGVRPFEILARGVRWVANYENTRWFLVLQVQKPSGDELNRLLHISNKTTKAFKQPPLYVERSSSAITEDSGHLDQHAHATFQKGLPSEKSVDMSSSFHISIGWTLKAPSQGDILKLHDVIEEEATNFRIFVEAVKVKIGNGITAMSLASKAGASVGIIGT